MVLDELYQQIILDHYKHPKNQGHIDHPDVSVEGRNPFCGDEVVLELKIENDRVTDVAFHGSGCAISQASASLMTEKIKGKSISEVQEMLRSFSQMVKGEVPEIDEETLDELIAFQGVSEFPTRIKCALLAWNALRKGLAEKLSHQ